MHPSITHINFKGIHFHVLERGPGVYPMWHVRTSKVKRKIPGSNITYRQRMGAELAPWTVKIAFDTLADYRRFVAELDQSGRLTLLADFQVIRGEHEVYEEREFEHFDDVVLDNIRDEVIEVDGTVEVVATFERAVDPVTGRQVTS